MAGIETIDTNLVNREIRRFTDRIGMPNVPDFDPDKALIFGTAGGRISLELDKNRTCLIVSFANKPVTGYVDETLKLALEKSVFKGEIVLTAMYVDPYVILSTVLNNQEIEAVRLENVLRRLIQLWEEIRDGQ